MRESEGNSRMIQKPVVCLKSFEKVVSLVNSSSHRVLNLVEIWGSLERFLILNW
jgi:hypothetical protein